MKLSITIVFEEDIDTDFIRDCFDKVDMFTDSFRLYHMGKNHFKISSKKIQDIYLAGMVGAKIEILHEAAGGA